LTAPAACRSGQARGADEATIAQDYLDPFWCFGFSMNPVASRVGPMPAPIAHRDYWMLALAVDGNVYGTSSMGGYPTGAFFSSGPRYALEAVDWSCDLYPRGSYVCRGTILHDAGPAASLTVAEDMAASAALVHSSIGDIRASCVGHDGTVQAGDTECLPGGGRLPVLIHARLRPHRQLDEPPGRGPPGGFFVRVSCGLRTHVRTGGSAIRLTFGRWHDGCRGVGWTPQGRFAPE
jgi:hypothetical protein